MGRGSPQGHSIMETPRLRALRSFYTLPPSLMTVPKTIGVEAVEDNPSVSFAFCAGVTVHRGLRPWWVASWRLLQVGTSYGDTCPDFW